jgi:predicted permease
MDALVQDLRFAWRSLRHNVAFTATAVLTLALGVGVNAAVFSVVNAALFRPLPFRNPDRLMVVSLVMPPDPRRPGTSDMLWSYPKYAAFRKTQTLFSDVGLSVQSAVNIADENTAERVNGEIVTASYFQTLGIRAARGRTFGVDEDSIPSSRPVVVLSGHLWHQKFGDDPGLVGRSITLDGRPYTVLGIIESEFRGLSGVADFWVPVHVRSADDLSQPWAHQYTLVARLRPGVAAEQASAAMPGLGRTIDELYPNPHEAGEQPLPWSARARLMNDTRTNPQLRRVLYMLWAAVGCVLLVAAANVAGMQLARSSARRREMALRFALGASRGRVIRQLLTESLVLTAVSTAAGLGLGVLALEALFAGQVSGAAQIALRSAGFSAVLLSGVHVDVAATTVTVALAFVVGIAFGLIPATHASRSDLAEAMRGDEAVPPRNSRGLKIRGREMLVIAQVALAFTLVVAAALLGRSVGRLMSIRPGFDPRGVLTARIALPSSAVNADSMPTFYQELVHRISALPGVTSVALSDCPPLSGGCSATFPSYLDRVTSTGEMPLVGVHWATPTFFQTLGVPLQRGRVFNALDRAGMPRVIVVSETMANQLWPGQDPIGKRLRIGQGGFNDGAEVIGVVGDMRFGAIDSVPRADVFIPVAQSPRRGLVLLIRSSLPPSALVGPVRAEVAAVAPRLPLYDIRTMEERIGVSVARPRFGAEMLVLFGTLALVLAGVGIYGLLAFVVARRTREIGIRMALGAEAATVVRMVLHRGVALVLAGVACGTAIAIGMTRLLSSLLYDAPAIDLAAYVVAMTVFLAMAGIACWVPAHRAASVDPVIAFRTE